MKWETEDRILAVCQWTIPGLIILGGLAFQIFLWTHPDITSRRALLCILAEECQ